MLRYIYETVSKITNILSYSRNHAGILQVEAVLRHSRSNVDAFSLTSIDFGDKTTWYQNAVQEVTHVLTDTSDHIIYSSHFPNWINIDSKRITAAERYIRKIADDSLVDGPLLMADGTFKTKSVYRVVVTRNNVLVDPSEYTVNYVEGSISFNGTNAPEDTIRASFWYCNPVNGSQFIVRPYAGRRLFLEHTEIQFSKAIGPDMPTVGFQLWSGKDDMDYNYIDPTDYAYYCGYAQQFRGGRDYINIGNEGKGSIPAFGDLTGDILVFPFMYLNSISLGPNCQGNAIRLYTKDDATFTNSEMATVTFYLEDRPSENFL